MDGRRRLLEELRGGNGVFFVFGGVVVWTEGKGPSGLDGRFIK
jgi:hypothetical protein